MRRTLILGAKVKQKNEMCKDFYDFCKYFERKIGVMGERLRVKGERVKE